MAEDKLYLTVGREKRQPENDGYIATISFGQPQLGDMDVLVVGVKLVKNMKEADAWFKRYKHERPWEPRN